MHKLRGACQWPGPGPKGKSEGSGWQGNGQDKKQGLRSKGKGQGRGFQARAKGQAWSQGGRCIQGLGLGAQPEAKGIQGRSRDGQGHEVSQRPREMAKLPASQVSGRINRLEGRRYSARIFVWHKPKQRSKARGALGLARRSQKGARMARARTEAFRPRPSLEPKGQGLEPGAQPEAKGIQGIG